MGSDAARPRTQSSIAISGDERRWFLCNASPDIARQLAACEALRPRGAVRGTPIQAVLLTDAELDHTVGLLSLREARRLRIYATPRVHRALGESSGLLRTLAAYCELDWRPIQLGEPIQLSDTDGDDTGLRVAAFATGGTKPTAYAGETEAGDDAIVGLRLSDTRSGRVLVYLPALQAWNETVCRQVESCACVLFDGTCWTDDELPRLGISAKTARTMGHLPVSGPEGSLERLAALRGVRRIYTHINNTNPMLLERSLERLAVQARGIEVADDGMEFEI
jgi:pyrroloquinoline quinone biosynthesis protein B